MSVDAVRSHAIPPNFVEGSLLFADRTAEKPFVYGGPTPAGAPPETAMSRRQAVLIERGRAAISTASLDVEGFTLANHESAVRNFWDDDQASGLGRDEAGEIVRHATGADRVIVFDHIVRKRTPPGYGNGKLPTRQPATRVHVDYTATSGQRRAHDLVAGIAEDVFGRRAAIINVWRPIAHAALDWPLALCDACSVAPEHLIGTDVVYPDRRGEIYYVAHSRGQRWAYVPDLRPAEVLLFKCWDSDPRVAQFVPHAAFADPTTPPGSPARESVEFRVLSLF